MSELINLLLLFAIAVPGWLVFNKLKLPGAPILGAMLAVGISQIYGFGPGPLPTSFKPVLQIVVGMFIGLRVRPDARRLLAGMLPVAALVSAWWLVAALCAGYMLYNVTQLTLPTAMLGSTPGGISEMGLMALHFGADAPSVALLQFFRVTLVLVVVPIFGPRLYPLLERWSGRAAVSARAMPRRQAQPVATAAAAAAGAIHVAAPPAAAAAPCPGPGSGRVTAMPALLIYLRTLAAAALGGLALEATGFPAGGLVGAMLAVGALRICSIACASFPNDMRSLAQAGLGGLIGLSFTAEMVRSFSTMVLPVVMLTTTLLGFGFVLAMVMHRVTGWDIRTCVLSTCAGGLTNISSVADDLGADGVTVTLLHVVRLITIVAVLPPVFATLFR